MAAKNQFTYDLQALRQASLDPAHFKIKSAELWAEVDFSKCSDDKISNLYSNSELRKHISLLENPTIMPAFIKHIN